MSRVLPVPLRVVPARNHALTAMLESTVVLALRLASPVAPDISILTKPPIAARPVPLERLLLVLDLLHAFRVAPIHMLVAPAMAPAQVVPLDTLPL